MDDGRKGDRRGGAAVHRISLDDDVAVIGTGAMGAGIAEVAARAGHAVRLHDARPEAAARAVEDLARRLDRDVARGRLEPTEAGAVLGRVRVVDRLDDLAGCGVVVEAVVEDLEVKRTLLRAVEDVAGQGVGREVVLATNTSSLSITAIAAALRRPGLLVGLHFFNPAPRMSLVEVVRGDATDPKVVDTAAELVRDWGKTPVLCSSTPGFVVNRVARPFYGEAQRLAEAGVASPATIDAVLRDAGGFPMGPFQLTDLVGQDVNLAVSTSVWEQTYHDPRYAPTAFQRRLVEAGPPALPRPPLRPHGLPAAAGRGGPARAQDRPGRLHLHRRRGAARRGAGGRAGPARARVGRGRRVRLRPHGTVPRPDRRRRSPRRPRRRRGRGDHGGSARPPPAGRGAHAGDGRVHRPLVEPGGT